MIANDYRVQGLGVIAISVTMNYPQDSPELMTNLLLKIILNFLICMMKHRKPKPTKPPALLTSFI
jgi:hypothetical protein